MGAAERQRTERPGVRGRTGQDLVPMIVRYLNGNPRIRIEVPARRSVGCPALLKPALAGQQNPAPGALEK